MHVTCNTVQHGRFPHPFEKNTIFRVELVSGLTYEFCSCIDIAVNQILTKSAHLVQWHYDFFRGGGQSTVRNHHPIKYGHFLQWHCDFLFWESLTTEHHHKPAKYGPLVQWHCKFFLGVSNDWALSSTVKIEINMSFEYGLGAYSFWITIEGLWSRAHFFLECVPAVNGSLRLMLVYSFSLS